ncbi:hypothetical protein NM688_g2215 [Phlebia brevispora]|uniref:Uncharacterized protein n=1 Tax=Phlebia brevispora TaxID=194682 RepID=A0ACC1T9H9_9APHY|nr:hypothetical protein NM688_g2215 [Phlebia brevispora]
MENSTDPAPVPLQLSVNSTLGAVFIGNVVAAVLYGTSSLQTYIYFNRCKDAIWLRMLIFFLWVIDTVHLCLSTYMIYSYAVTDFANPARLNVYPWSLSAIIAVTATEGMITQCIYAYRLWLVSQKKRWLIAIIMIPVLYSYIMTFVLVGHSAKFSTMSESRASHLKWMTYSTLSGVVVADIIIAISLGIVLWHFRTGIRQTDGLIRNLIAYSINAGVLTSLCALLIFITYATMPNNFIYTGLYFILPKSYFNSLLALLNARKKLRQGSGWGGAIDIPLSSISGQGAAGLKTRVNHYSTSERPIEIQVDTDSNRKTDSTSPPRLDNLVKPSTSCLAAIC